MPKDKILRTAIDLFSRYGIKGVSMSQIATILQISKKTLYTEFSNKEELLQECLKYEDERIRKLIRETEKESQNSLEALIFTMSSMFHYRSNFCPAFFRDIERYTGAQETVLSTKDALQQLYMRYFNQGITEGYFQNEFEYEPIASLFITQLGDWNNLKQPYIIFTFLRSVCTPKGIDSLDRFVPFSFQ